MRVFWALGIMVLATASGSTAHATPPSYSDYSDYIVISVVPRSPTVQPLVMAVPARERQKREAALQAGALTPIVQRK
jgi:hypothetical protein